MRFSVLGSMLALCVMAGCDSPASAPEPIHDLPPETAGSPESVARQIFSSRCAACHGASGGGDGVAAAALTPRPRDFHDGEWQRATTDANISAAILRGGAAIGKSPSMPPNPDLANKPAELAALVAMVRAMR